jgi:hypothetical protein
MQRAPPSFDHLVGTSEPHSVGGAVVWGLHLCPVET